MAWPLPFSVREGKTMAAKNSSTFEGGSGMQAKKRVISKIVCAAFAVLSLSSVGMMYASAANYLDSDWKANFTFSQHQYYTQTRAKEDDSSMYIKVTSGSSTGRLNARGYGSDYVKPEGHAADGRVNCSQGRVTSNIVVGESRYIVNFVYEMGYDFGCLLLGNGVSTPDTFAGLWSPDSV